MKETSANVNQENESRKYYLSEFSYDDGEYEITFNILDVNFVYETIMVTIKELKRDNKAALKYLHEKFSFDFQKPVTINEATPPQAAGYPPLT